MSYLLQSGSRFLQLQKMDRQPHTTPYASAVDTDNHTSRVLQPKVSNVVQQQAGAHSLAYVGSAVTNKAASQPLQSRSNVPGTHTSLAAESQSAFCSPEIQSEVSPKASATSDGMQQAQHLSIPGQVELHQHALAGLEDAQRPCSDKPAGPDAASGCNVEHLADVSEQSGNKPSEGVLSICLSLYDTWQRPITSKAELVCKHSILQ